MPEKPRNVGASVRQRLLILAHARGQPLELLLTRYALERLLHRLSISPHRHRFVLKGALLLTTWFEEPHRATRDLDLLGFGDPSRCSPPPRGAIARVGVPHYEGIPAGPTFFENVIVGGGPAPVRAYIDELLPDVLGGLIQPGRVSRP